MFLTHPYYHMIASQTRGGPPFSEALARSLIHMSLQFMRVRSSASFTYSLFMLKSCSFSIFLGSYVYSLEFNKACGFMSLGGGGGATF